MTACSEDMQTAHRAWERMQSVGRWTPKHTAAVRTSLGRALLVHVPGLAAVINPLARPVTSTTYVTTTSHEGRFRLHDCLPARVRRLPPWQTDAALFRRLIEEFASHLRSLSRGNLLKLSGWLDRLLWGRVGSGGGGGGPVWTDETSSVDGRWSLLQGLGPRDWLQRYAIVTAPHSLCFTLFKRQMHWLRLLHAQVLLLPSPQAAASHRRNNGASSSSSSPRLTIPTPRPSGRLTRTKVGIHEDHHHPLLVDDVDDDNDRHHHRHGDQSSSGSSDEGALSGLSAFASMSGSASEVEDESYRQQRLGLRDALFALQERVVRPEDPVTEANRRYSFTCDEVRRIVACARSHLERLVVMIFLKTGLRLGGVSRLQLPSAVNRPGPDENVPEILTTIEKNGRLRRILLPPVCRLLVSNWLHERGPSNGPWLFPSSARGGNGLSSVHKNTVWRICHGVFRRAKLSGPHVHPHTFRHTVIKILYMNDIPFEKIAKWIGHSSAAITSTTYHRLQEHELQRLVFHLPSTSPYTDPALDSDPRKEWRDLSRFLDDPFRVKRNAVRRVGEEEAEGGSDPYYGGVGGKRSKTASQS